MQGARWLLKWKGEKEEVTGRNVEESINIERDTEMEEQERNVINNREG